MRVKSNNNRIKETQGQTAGKKEFSQTVGLEEGREVKEKGRD